MQKYLVAPDSMPKELHWFKYESYFTWISGFALLVVTYYWGAEAFLIDSSVQDLSVLQAIGISVGSLVAGWIVYDVVCKTPIGRNLLLLGAAVYMIIILAAYHGQVFGLRAPCMSAPLWRPYDGQRFLHHNSEPKKVVASLQRGEAPDPTLGQYKATLTHNNYLTLPVLFMMLSNHYPMTFVGEDLWILVGLVVLIGAIIRDYFNTSHSGAAGLRDQVVADGIGINHHTRAVDQARNIGTRCRRSLQITVQYRDDPLCRLSRSAAHGGRLYRPAEGRDRDAI